MTMIQSLPFVLSAVMVALVPTAVLSDNQIPEWLPVCFETSSFVAMFQCLKENAQPQCFKGNGESLQDIVDCVDDELPEFTSDIVGGGQYLTAFFNATRNCLDPYVDCVNQTIQERISNLEPCVNTTLTNLTQCAKDHASECAANCTDAVPEDNPFADVSVVALMTCNGIQSEIMDPACSIVDCCQPCVEPFEELMECIVNDVLDHTIQDCDFECPDGASSPELRFLRPQEPPQQQAGNSDSRHDEAHHFVSRRLDPNGDSTGLQSCLQYTPGVAVSDNKAQELSAHSEFFLPCVYAGYVHEMEEANKHNNQTTSSAGASINFPGVGRMFGALLVLVLASF